MIILNNKNILILKFMDILGKRLIKYERSIENHYKKDIEIVKEC